MILALVPAAIPVIAMVVAIAPGVFNFIKDSRFLFEEYGVDFADIQMLIGVYFADFLIEEGLKRGQDALKLFGLVETIAILCEDNNLALQVIERKDPLFLQFGNIVEEVHLLHFVAALFHLRDGLEVAAGHAVGVILGLNIVSRILDLDLVFESVDLEDLPFELGVSFHIVLINPIQLCV